jgi:hypothetical protein
MIQSIFQYGQALMTPTGAANGRHANDHQRAVPRRSSHQRQPPQGGNAIALPLLEPVPRSAAPNGGAFKRHAIGFSLAHCAVLEPDELSKRYAIAPDRRSNAGKAAAAEMSANGIEAVSEPEMALALNMADAVRQHPYAAALLADGKAEQSFWWDDKATGQRCKCRPDWYQGTTIVDLKTCQDASPGAFARACATFGYHTQAAHYLNGTFADRFVFVAVEKTYPYALASTS